jgi:anhydro-N-acetylmuramic acid kinase
MAELQKVIGLMSGTSLDGIDAALVETDGQDIVRPGQALFVAYSAEMRALLKDALVAASALAVGGQVPQSILDAEQRLTDVHADAVGQLLAVAGVRAEAIALLGFHGQTILHRPQEHRTWQIGDGARLARLTGIDVVNDFRSADMDAGGEGAPFAPLYHAALARRTPGLKLPVAVLNVGGVANVTFVGRETVLAFDTGPGNAPMDDWAMKHLGKPMDENGKLARSGRVDARILARMLENPFFARRPPKSLDRMDFGFEPVNALSPADGAATSAAFTAASIARAAEHFPEPISEWIMCGGGRYNKALLGSLRMSVRVPVRPAEDVGWRGDFIEAEAFAYLAARSAKGLPLSLPTTTGAPNPTTGGRLHRYDRRLTKEA